MFADKLSDKQISELFLSSRQCTPTATQSPLGQPREYILFLARSDRRPRTVRARLRTAEKHYHGQNLV